jgi:hypothetical protein
MTIDELRHELFLAPMKSNFTFTRDELIALIGLPGARCTVSGQEAPSGWKLMPMIPTVEMTVAARAVTHSPCTAYALFLDAAPIPATEPK